LEDNIKVDFREICFDYTSWAYSQRTTPRLCGDSDRPFVYPGATLCSTSSFQELPFARFRNVLL